jgi:hypothetical protein
MNCPACGLATVPEQKFCRSCGGGLQLITRPLPRPVEPANAKATPYVSQDERQSALVHWGFIALFVGVVIGIIGKKVVHEEVVAAIGAILAVVGMFLVTTSRARRKTFDSSSGSAREVPASSQPDRSLPEGTEINYVSSVTEKTTDLLEPARVATKSRPEK